MPPRARWVGRYPRSATAEFQDRHGRTWNRYYLARALSSPIAFPLLPEEKKRILREFFGRLFEKEFRRSLTGTVLRSVGGVYSAVLSPILLERSRRSSVYLVNRLRELRNAIILPLFFSDDAVIESLLNNKRVTPHIYGLGAAAGVVYRKEAGSLNERELDAILEYIYFRHRTWYRNVTPEEASAMRRKLLERESRDEAAAGRGGYFRDYCLRTLQGRGIPADGESLKVSTTYDPRMQEIVEKYAVEYLVKLKDQDATRKWILSGLDPVEAAVIVADSKTGAIRAMTGGLRYSGRNPLNRAVQSRRQVSSTFKPFLYALAMETRGLTPDSEFEDKPLKLKNRDGSPWEPKNFYPYYIGKVTLREGLVISINTVAVQLIELTGAESTAWKAREIFDMPGNEVDKRILPEASLSLGSVDLSPLEVLKGYLLISGDGTEVFPYAVTGIDEAAGGRELYRRKNEGPGKRIFRKETMAALRGILEEVVERGTASAFIREPLKFPVGGKSGSSPSDSWFVGYSDRLLVLVWAGYDNPRSSGRGKLPEFIVIPLWYGLMNALHEVR